MTRVATNCEFGEEYIGISINIRTNVIGVCSKNCWFARYSQYYPQWINDYFVREDTNENGPY